MSSYCKVLCLLSSLVFANPYPDPNAVPKDGSYTYEKFPGIPLDYRAIRASALTVLRVDVSWSQGEKYQVDRYLEEKSGTPALVKRAKTPDKLGSYHGQLVSRMTGKAIAFDSVGTGKEYRLLSRGMTFRFPVPTEEVDFVLVVENPSSGLHQLVLKEKVMKVEVASDEFRGEVRLIKAATTPYSLKVAVYSEGFSESKKEKFFQDAKRVSDALKAKNFPYLDRMEITGVFQASNQTLGPAQDLGLPVKVRDSFLGLYFPYWDNFGRWYHVIYPTSERKTRDAFGSVPYDYPIVVVDSGEYWGVGNFNMYTALPNGSSSFNYLLVHELGHYFGLNEEYENGGMTELAFAPGISEPWSQNNTFLADPKNVKWKNLILASTPIPTPASLWTGNGPYGAYKGGYAQTPPLGKSHKPGINCVMSSGPLLCPVCRDAIEKKAKFDLNE